MKVESMSKLGRMAAAGAFVAGSLFAAQAAFACTVDNWSTSFGNLAAGSPIEGVARYSGLCAVQTPGGEVSYVQDNNPGGIGRIIARFYVLADNTEDAVIYRGFDSGGSALFNVSLAADGQVTLSSGGTSTPPVAGVPGNWNSIEIDWNAADGLVLTVNSEPPASVAFSASSMVDSVRLGNLNGAAGTLNFDSYESRRSTEVGRLCNCNADASSDDVVDIGDIISSVTDAGETSSLAPGTPDCDENGVIDIGDIIETVTLAGSTGMCEL